MYAQSITILSPIHMFNLLSLNVENTYLGDNGIQQKVFTFKMIEPYAHNDFIITENSFDLLFDQLRNLTLWHDEDGNLALAMAKLEVKKSIDLASDYDVIESIDTSSCSCAVDTLHERNLQIVFYDVEFVQFRTTHKYRQFFAVSY